MTATRRRAALLVVGVPESLSIARRRLRRSVAMVADAILQPP
jgi:hypothetical protein